MPAQLNADTVALQLEHVEDQYDALFEVDDTFYSELEEASGAEIDVSSREARFPTEIAPGGQFRKADFDGGSLGLGSATDYEKFTVTPTDFTIAIQQTYKSLISTNDKKKAVANAINREVKSGMRRMRATIDAASQTAGNGVISTITSFSSTTWTLGGNFKTKLLYVGMPVRLYASDLTTARTGGTTPSIIQTIDEEAGTIIVDGNPTGIANADVLVFDGITGATPTFLRGVSYHHSSAATGTYQGLNRATFPQIRTSKVAGGSALLTLDKVRLALSKIKFRLGGKMVPDSIVAYLGPAQLDAYEQLVQLMMDVIKTESAKQSIDPYFGQKTMAGHRILENIHADPTRIDFMNLKKWKRVTSKPIGNYEIGGRRVWETRASDGAVSTGILWYLVCSMDIVNVNPIAGSYVDALALPTGYT